MSDSPQQLWSPWRMQYVRTARASEDNCIFCELPAKEDAEAHVLKRTPRAYVVMNAFPYNPGHLMVAPYRHVGSPEMLDTDELMHTGTLLQEAIQALNATMNPDGFNIGMNLGRVAGAGFPDHMHWHVVPRWNGDVNFMPVVGQTRVLPELVDETYRKLRPGFAAEAT